MKRSIPGSMFGILDQRPGARFPIAVYYSFLFLAGLFFSLSPVVHAETVTAPIRQLGTGLLNRAAWSPDEKFIATCGPRGGVFLWNAATGERVRTFTGHTGSVSAAAFSADGKWLVTGSYDLTVRLWEVATGRQLQVFSGHTDWVMDVAISRDGTKILSGSRDKTARLWDVTTGKTTATLSGHNAMVYAVAISPDGRKAVTGCIGPDRTARLWDLATAKATYTVLHPSSVYAVTFSPDGKQVASSGDGSSMSGNSGPYVLCWSTETGKLAQSIIFPAGTYSAVFSLAYSSDASSLYAGVEGFGLQGGTTGYNSEKYGVYACNVARGSVTGYLVGNTDRIHSLAVSADGIRLMVGSSDGTARMWQLSDGSPLQTLKLHTYRIDSLAFSPDRKTVLVGEKDGTARLWDWRTGAQRMEIREAATTVTALYPGIRRCAFSPSGARFLTSMPDGLVHVRAADTGLPIATIDAGMARWPDASFAQNEREILTSGPVGARLWDLGTGKVLRTFGTQIADALALSPNGQRLATCWGVNIRVWNTLTGDPVSTCTNGSGYSPALMSMAFFPDGNRLLAGYNNQDLIVWDTGAGSRINTLKLSSYSGDRYASTYAVAPASDGIHFLSAGTCIVTSPPGVSYYGGMAWLWDAGSGSVVRTWDHHEQRNIYAAAFSPGGELLLTGSDDGTVVLWKSDPNQNAVGGWKIFE